jgi:hypothetical protein
VSDWLDEGGTSVPVDVVAMLDGRAGDLLHEVAGCGALVSMGTTSDGGALGVTVTVDGRWRREYFRDGDALGDWLAGGADSVRKAVEASRSVRASSGRGGRRKGL